jgi:hypothetical protein
MEKEKTAVEWLKNNFETNETEIISKNIEVWFKIAKEMEKQMLCDLVEQLKDYTHQSKSILGHEDYEFYMLHTEVKNGWFIIYTNDVKSCRGQICSSNPQMRRRRIIKIVDWDKNAKLQKINVFPEMIKEDNDLDKSKGQHYLIKEEYILATTTIQEILID